MAKYRKKPVVIEAVQLLWSTWDEVCEFADVGKLTDGKPEGCYISGDGLATENHPGVDEIAKIGLHIPTLEGLHLAREGDWIIKGVRGELYPCKPDIFEATYEAVEAKMGDRYIITVTCPECGLDDDDVYYAPTCGFTDWTCMVCGHKIDLEEYTGISAEDASNAVEIGAAIESVIGGRVDAS